MTANLKGLRWLILLVLVSGFVATAERLKTQPRQSVALELQVALPLFVQVFMSAGDRYLAADLAAIRALVVATDKMRPEDYRILGKVQEDASWLNPAHEDNYYIAAAILSVPEVIPAAQYILRRAADARPRDWQPLFYYGFNRYYFEKDPVAGAQALLEAVPRMRDEGESWTMQNLAARWIERGYSAADAARIVGGMADNANPGRFKRYLNHRAQRLRDLAMLKDAAARFRETHGRRLNSLDELVTTKIVERIPEDPFRRGYTLDPQGEPVFAPRR